MFDDGVLCLDEEPTYFDTLVVQTAFASGVEFDAANVAGELRTLSDGAQLG